MTDVDLLLQKLTFIETCVRDLRTLARPDAMRHDVREARFVLHTLEIAIQAALDAASHIVSDERLGEPETNRELFERLAQGGWLTVELAETMAQQVTSNQVLMSKGGVKLYPVQLHYAWPSELDLMARVAGLRLRTRWGRVERRGVLGRQRQSRVVRASDLSHACHPGALSLPCGAAPAQRSRLVQREQGPVPLPGARSTARLRRGHRAEASRHQPPRRRRSATLGRVPLRIYRDTRFTPDKKPSKTNAGLFFRLDAGKDVEAPGYYLHLEPGQVFTAAGLWRPSADALRAIRGPSSRIPPGWKRAKRLGLSHGESSLKRPPRGFSAEHPLIEDLKRTSFTVGEEFTERQACSTAFPTLFVGACRREAALMKFLAEALGLSF